MALPGGGGARGCPEVDPGRGARSPVSSIAPWRARRRGCSDRGARNVTSHPPRRENRFAQRFAAAIARIPFTRVRLINTRRPLARGERRRPAYSRLNGREKKKGEQKQNWRPYSCPFSNRNDGGINTGFCRQNSDGHTRGRAEARKLTRSFPRPLQPANKNRPVGPVLYFRKFGGGGGTRTRVRSYIPRGPYVRVRPIEPLTTVAADRRAATIRQPLNLAGRCEAKRPASLAIWRSDPVRQAETGRASLPC
jgi:hypothetical protein